MNDRNTITQLKTFDMVYVALFAVLITICSWITIPTLVPFTLQTFGVFCAVGFLGGKRGTLAILIYVLLGVVGVPVFAGFKGGLGELLGMTGGYIIGFIFAGLIFWLITGLFGKKLVSTVIGMLAGLLVCYAFGSVWFMAVYSHNNGAVGIASVLSWCVLPFIIPDLVKLVIAVTIVKRVTRYVSI